MALKDIFWKTDKEMAEQQRRQNIMNAAKKEAYDNEAAAIRARKNDQIKRRGEQQGRDQARYGRLAPLAPTGRIASYVGSKVYGSAVHYAPKARKAFISGLGNAAKNMSGTRAYARRPVGPRSNRVRKYRRPYPRRRRVSSSGFDMGFPQFRL